MAGTGYFYALGQVENVVLEGLGLFGSQYLGIERPAGVGLVLNGFKEILGGEVRVFAYITQFSLAIVALA